MDAISESLPVSYIEAERYHLIEVLAQWEGRVNAADLQRFFGISRQSASGVIGAYQKYLPDNLIYNPSRRAYCPTPLFTPRFSCAHFDEYSQSLIRAASIHNLSENTTAICHLEAPLRNMQAAWVQPIIQAIRENLRLDIGYTSVSTPEYESRIISPHSLVFDGIRWHTRAYCEKNRDYRDFVLSRFSGDFAFEGSAIFSQQQDERWNTWLELEIVPDPRLSADQRRIIELDYQMSNGRRIIAVRAALLIYLIHRLGLKHYDSTPEAQQIIIGPDCLKRLQPYLPK